MAITIAFDVYGTLVDTQGIRVALEEYVGNKAKQLSLLWRQKQLEYSFRRALMQSYCDFDICTQDALDYACLFHAVSLSDQDKQTLLSAYKKLPSFEDVKPSLIKCRSAGFRLFAFSNGKKDSVEQLLEYADIREYFIDVVSVDNVRSFKPNPAVYRFFLRESSSIDADTWLVSSNPFDVIGAISSGIRAIWLKRTPDEIFDPWGIKPTLILNNMEQITSQLGNT